MVNTAPFGNPDGSRSDLSEILAHFVEFDKLKYGDGLGLLSEELGVRVIVGTKGSGKTVYLRRLQNSAVRNDSVYADLIQQDLPDTDAIVKFCELFPREYLTDKWEKVWYCAILTSLSTHLLYHQKLQPLEPKDIALNILEYLPPRFPFRTPVSVYSALGHILSSFSTVHQFNQYLDSPNWPQLEYWLSQALREKPPVFFYLDSVDDKYDSAPMHWLQCQTGLFLRTMGFLRDFALGGRLHIVITVRDHVLASVFRTEHASKFRGEPHIRLLDWRHSAIEYLLHKKIERLSDADLMIPSKRGQADFEAWLGHKEIENLSRHITENVSDYLLRHTRLSPRDVVQLGNALSIEVRRARAAGYSSLPPEVIRRTVSDVAREIAIEQLKICANQIASSGMPPIAGRKAFSSAYIGDSEYVRGFVDRLREVITHVGKERFSWQELSSAAKNAMEYFGETSDAFSVLWQNRLVGYRPKKMGPSELRFFSESFTDEFVLPPEQQEYVFHSSLLDALHITRVGSIPPIQWRLGGD